MFVLWRNYLHNQATVQKRQIMEHDIKSCWGQSSHLTRYDGQIFCQNMCLMSGQRTYMHNVTRIMHWIVFLGINCQCGVDLIDGDECVIGWTNHTGTMVKTPQKTCVLVHPRQPMVVPLPSWLWGLLEAFFFLKPQEMLNLDSTTIIKSNFV
jgi:hypothetical protein